MKMLLVEMACVVVIRGGPAVEWKTLGSCGHADFSQNPLSALPTNVVLATFLNLSECCAFHLCIGEK